jgi:chromosome segregation ATPase
MVETVIRCGFIVILLAVGGCDSSMDDRRDSALKTADVAETQVTLRGAGEPAAQVQASGAGSRTDEAAASRRRSELRSQIEAVKSQRVTLQQEHARVSGLVQSHQADSEQKLAALKAEFTALQGREAGSAQSPSRDQFAERARNDLEAALSLDQEYLAQLSEVQKEIGEADAHLGELRSELRALDTRE